jgi:hypothetical protein
LAPSINSMDRGIDVPLVWPAADNDTVIGPTNQMRVWLMCYTQQ